MWDHIINIHLSNLMCTKTKSLELMNIKIFKKRTIFIFYLITFLQDFLKSKIYIYENDYQ